MRIREVQLDTTLPGTYDYLPLKTSGGRNLFRKYPFYPSYLTFTKKPFLSVSSGQFFSPHTCLARCYFSDEGKNWTCAVNMDTASNDHLLSILSVLRPSVDWTDSFILQWNVL